MCVIYEEFVIVLENYDFSVPRIISVVKFKSLRLSSRCILVCLHINYIAYTLTMVVHSCGAVTSRFWLSVYGFYELMFSASVISD